VFCATSETSYSACIWFMLSLTRLTSLSFLDSGRLPATFYSLVLESCKRESKTCVVKGSMSSSSDRYSVELKCYTNKQYPCMVSWDKHRNGRLLISETI